MTRKLSFLMAFILLFGIIFGVSPTLAASVNPRSAEGFEAYFLPYGRVDAILLGCDGEWAFVDGGYRVNGIDAVKFMRKLGIEKLDYYIGTHRHSNHVEAGPPIIDRMQCSTVINSGSGMHTRLLDLTDLLSEKRSIRAARFKGLKNGASFNLGGAVITRIGPRTIRNCNPDSTSENYNSMILMVSYGGKRMLLTGDALGAEIKACGDIKANVLKNAHHNQPLSKAVLKRVSPEFVVICNSTPASRNYRNLIESVGAKVLTAARESKGGDGVVHITF